MPTNGQMGQIDFFDNTGGVNLSDAVFRVKESQSTGALNVSYLATGGISKRRGHTKLNSVADTQTTSFGMSQYAPTTGSKFIVRTAGQKWQNFDPAALTFTNLTEDASPGTNTNFLASNTAQPVVFSQFNTSNASVLWGAGGGMTGIYGAYSSTKVTKNGVDTPTGSISTSVGGSGGSFASTGTYYYAVAWRKTATQALSNAALDKPATVTVVTQKVTIDLTGITNPDTSKYDKLYIYRSSSTGVSSFTTGDLIAKVDATIALTNYVDDGTFLSTAENVPRAGNTLLDNSTFPSGSPTVLTSFKRRLVSAIGSTIYFSDLNKPESWPAANFITIPSGGSITGLGVISFTTAGSNTIDELLVIFKESELWVVTGSSISDFALKLIDIEGCPNQSLVVSANGFLCWVNYRGIFMWDGTSKPIYTSRPIEPLFNVDGDLDKSKFTKGIGQFFRKENFIVWSVASKTYGENQFQIKLDLRLTIPAIEAGLVQRVLDGVFLFDTTSFPVYAMASFIPTTPNEKLYMGDGPNAATSVGGGYVYDAYIDTADADAAYSLLYNTKFLDCGNPNIDKRYHYVVVWVEEVGDWNLTLDWWTDYNTSRTNYSTRALPISTKPTTPVALWDIAFWDVAFWDDYTSNLKPLFFRLSSDAMNNSEGKAIKIRFRQDGADQPITIHGFSLLFTEKGMVTTN